MSIALYRRYRPQSFTEVIGQDHVTDPLMAALAAGRTTHAYLFSGPRGCGKTTSARILARCLNCVEYPTATPCGECDSCKELSRHGSGSLDVVEVDAASHGGVDDARELREQAGFSPVRDRFKIFIIDEAHMVTNHGFNALLKLVEEPPAHVKFIFATTEPEKVIGTIRSRTHHYPFRLVPPPVLENYLQEICAQENISAPAEVLSLVVRAGTGSVRDTLSVLDQIIGGSDGVSLQYDKAVALLGYTSAHLLDLAVEALIAQDGAALFAVVDDLVRSGHDPRRFVEDLLQRLRDLIILALASDSARNVFVSVPEDQYQIMQDQAGRLTARRASRSADLVNEVLHLMVGATAPRLQLELLCARLIMAQTEGEGVSPGVARTPEPAGAGRGALAVTPPGAKPGLGAVSTPSSAVTSVNKVSSAPENAEGIAGRVATPSTKPMPDMPNLEGLSDFAAGVLATNISAENTAFSLVSESATEVSVPSEPQSSAESTTTTVSEQPVANSAPISEPVQATGEILSTQTPFVQIRQVWEKIIDLAKQRLPQSAHKFNAIVELEAVENGVVYLGFARLDQVNAFNSDIPSLNAVAFSIFEITGLKTRVQAVYVAGDAPPKVLADSQLAAGQLSSPSDSAVPETNTVLDKSENGAEVAPESVVASPITDSLAPTSTVAITDTSAQTVTDPAGVLAALVDGSAQIVTGIGQNHAVSDNQAIQEEVTELADAALSDATQEELAANTECVVEITDYLHDIPDVPPALSPFVNTPATSDNLAGFQAHSGDSFAQNNVFNAETLQEFMEVANMPAGHSKTDRLADITAQVGQRLEAEGLTGVFTTGAQLAAENQAKRAQETELAQVDEADLVSADDEIVDATQLFGVNIVLETFGGQIIQELPNKKD